MDKDRRSWFSTADDSILKAINLAAVTGVAVVGAVGGILWGAAQLFQPHLLHLNYPPAAQLRSEIRTQIFSDGDRQECVVYVSNRLQNDGESRLDVWGQRLTARLDSNSPSTEPRAVPNVALLGSKMLYDDGPDTSLVRAAENAVLEPKEARALWRAIRIPLTPATTGLLVVNSTVFYGPDKSGDGDIMLCYRKAQDDMGFCHHQYSQKCATECLEAPNDQYHGAKRDSAIVVLPNCTKLGDSSASPSVREL
jgi:hypothetical protein